MVEQDQLQTFKKTLIESITRHYNETIDFVESAFKVFTEPKIEEDKITYEFPPENETNAGPIIWLHKQLKDQAEKGHIKDFDYLQLADRTVFSFTLVKKEDRNMFDKWFQWAKEKASSGGRR